MHEETIGKGTDLQMKGFTARVQTLVLLTLSLQNTAGTSRSSLPQNCNQIHTQGAIQVEDTITDTYSCL